MIYIDFFGGTHGHFLEYSINALDDEVKKFNPFTEFGTSHNSFPKKIAKADHYSEKNIHIAGDIINIVASDDDDCLLVNLLNFGRAGDYNFDLDNLEKNLGDTLRGTPYHAGFRNSLLMYNIDIDAVKSVPRGVLRESLKYNFLVPSQNSLMKNIHMLKYVGTGLNVYIRTLYNSDTYIGLLEQIIDRYKLPYSVDTKWFLALFASFTSRVEQINEEQYSKQVLADIVNLQNTPIQFNIVQEAWLNAELENKFHIEMPPEQEQYFVDTDSVNKYLKRL